MTNADPEHEVRDVERPAHRFIQPPGADTDEKRPEKDDMEHVALHIAAWTPEDTVVGVGRAHFVDAETAQVRYMAVSLQGQGVGHRLLQWLEYEVKARGARRVILNARDTALPFYIKQGYTALHPVEAPGLSIPHTFMEKHLH